jgi:hypothetical protein
MGRSKRRGERFPSGKLKPGQGGDLVAVWQRARLDWVRAGHDPQDAAWPPRHHRRIERERGRGRVQGRGGLWFRQRRTLVSCHPQVTWPSGNAAAASRRRSTETQGANLNSARKIKLFNLAPLLHRDDHPGRQPAGGPIRDHVDKARDPARGRGRSARVAGADAVMRYRGNLASNAPSRMPCSRDTQPPRHAWARHRLCIGRPNDDDIQTSGRAESFGK